MTRPFTVEEIQLAARESRAAGFPDLAVVFDRLADKLATFNENHDHTVEEARQTLGDQEFWHLFDAVRSHQ